jgi:hypothetical protein
MRISTNIYININLEFNIIYDYKELDTYISSRIIANISL